MYALTRSWKEVKRGQLYGVIFNTTDGVTVGDGPGVECSVVTAGKRTVHLGHDVQTRRTLGAVGCVLPQHGFRRYRAGPVAVVVVAK